MTSYRTKTVQIQARRVLPDSAEDIAKWCNGMAVVDYDAITHGDAHVGVNVPTLEGVLRASQGDWVVQTESGHFNKMTDAEFQAQYESHA